MDVPGQERGDDDRRCNRDQDDSGGSEDHGAICSIQPHARKTPNAGGLGRRGPGHCAFTVSAPLEEARQAFEGHECEIESGRRQGSAARMRGGARHRRDSSEHEWPTPLARE